MIRIVCFPENVFSALLLAAFSAAIPVVQASSITTGAAIATCFAPEENCNAFAADAVNGAEREILVSAYSLTTGSGIPEALARAAQRGVDDRVIADRTTPCGRNAGVDLIVRPARRSGSTAACGSLTPKPWSLTARSRWSAR